MTTFKELSIKYLPTRPETPIKVENVDSKKTLFLNKKM